MATLPHSRRLHWAVHLLTAGLLFLAALNLAVWPELALTFFGWPRWLLAASGITALLAPLTFRPRLARPAAVGCLLIAAVLVGLGALELLFRAVGYDFDRSEAKLRQLPPFFRQPRVPTGSVFFRRAGPESWTGRPLQTFFEEQRVQPNPYTNEAAITVRYDALGFRNEPGLTDWELAVTGDSFTELGHLPFNQLFSTRLGELTGWRVRNLGVSHTGPFTHLHYLESFGLAASTRVVCIMFFEGNDPADLAREAAALETFAATGQRPKRGRRPQTSFLRAAHRAMFQRSAEPAVFVAEPNAWFNGVSGREPVTISSPPRLAADLPAHTREALDAFLREYARFGQRHGVTTWLAYLPAKETVLRGLIELGPEAPDGWRGSVQTDLPDDLARRCGAAGVRFLDLTPVLIAETRARRRLLFNGLYDTHLNPEGAEVVARALADSETGIAARNRRAGQSGLRRRQAPRGG